MTTIEYNLNRFLEAQSAAYETAHSEICAGRKRSHWMWYIFPQLKGLGRSATSEYYGIDGISEAKEFLAHPVLGNRLREVSKALIKLDINDAHRIFGSPDDMNLSCMTYLIKYHQMRFLMMFSQNFLMEIRAIKHSNN